jgi:hypothetical protein
MSPAAASAVIFEQPKVEDGFTRLNAPELYKFEKRGDVLSGVLSAITQIEIESEDRPGQKQRVTQFLISEHGRIFKLLGTYDLCQKLTRRYVGCMVRITFLGEDHKIKRGDNYMKVFDVQVKGSPSDPSEPRPFAATDEDIPF